MMKRFYPALISFLFLLHVPAAAASDGTTAKLPDSPSADSQYRDRCYLDSSAESCRRTVETINKIIEKDPRNSKTYYDRGRAYYRLGNYEKAIGDFSKAIELDLKFADAYNNRGLVYYKTGKYLSAVSDFTKTLELNPGCAEAVNNRGLAYFRLNQYDQALRDYETAIDLTPKKADAYVNRGFAYYKMGAIDKAYQDWKISARLGDRETRQYLDSRRIRYTTPHRIEGSFSYYKFDYKEDWNPPGKSMEEGWIPALRLGYSYCADDSGYFRGFYEFSISARTDYDGAIQPTNEPLASTTRDELRKFQIEIGYTFKNNLPVSITPYIGYGYRYWKRALQDGVGGRGTPVKGFTEDYSWSYIPLGLKIRYETQDRLSFGLNAAVNIMFNGKMTAYLSEAGPAYPDPELSLGNKIGYLLELPVTCSFTLNWAATLTPWYEYSAIGRSDVVSGVLEPASRTHQYGVRVGVEYIF
jgi:tetratricopeptide (TPR) repeat protein